jgi:teichuronic acid exporter
LLYVSAPSIASFYNQPELINLSRALFIVVITNAIAIVPRSKLLIEINFKTQSIINSVSMIVSAVVTIYMVSNGFSYWSLIGMNLSKSLTNCILFMAVSKWYPKWKFSMESFKTLFSFGSKIMLVGLIGSTVQNLNFILIGRYYNTTQVGYFQQGYNYTNLLATTLSSIVQGVAYPVMTSIQEDKKRLVKIYIKVMGVVSLLTFPVFAGLSAISEEFVLIFLGDKWSPMIPVLMILSFSRLITPISYLNISILNARGRSGLSLKMELLKIPVIVIALIIAIPYGIIAVAIAQLFSFIITFFINTYYPGKLFGFGAKAQLKQIFPIAIATIIMYISIVFIKLSSLEVQMFTKVIVGIVVYSLVCWLFKITAFTEVSNIILSKFKK